MDTQCLRQATGHAFVSERECACANPGRINGYAKPAAGNAFVSERECAWMTSANTSSANGCTSLRCRARRCAVAPTVIGAAPRLVVVINISALVVGNAFVSERENA